MPPFVRATFKEFFAGMIATGAQVPDNSERKRQRIAKIEGKERETPASWAARFLMFSVN